MSFELQDVLAVYGIGESTATIIPLGNGLINHTWKVSTPQGDCVLQRINNAVFAKPEDIDFNLRLLADYLKSNQSDYLFVAPLPARNGETLLYQESSYYRLFPFVRGSHTIDVVQTPQQAFEAAKQFGRFTRLLSGFEAKQLKTTIPNFHNLPLRFRQFVSAVESGNSERRSAAKETIAVLLSRQGIAEQYKAIQTNPQFKLRVTHHDTKISNVLFDANGRGLCVIDLDTVMPGCFMSDLGDMMRTYLSPASEEEADVFKIEVREEFYEAIVDGYASEMKSELTEVEKAHFFFAGVAMIYTQALRFLTDYLNNDAYYGARYEGHNLVRARNQTALLQRLAEKEERLRKIGVK